MPFHWMRTVLCILLGSWFFSTLALLADEPAPEPLTIESRYWQILPYVRWVYLDHAGDPWFSWRGGDVAASYDKPLHTLPEDEQMLLGDSKGRIWVSKRSNAYGTEPARYYDGSKWHETDIRARLATEDAKGRVFLLDATTIHVLHGDRWSRHQIFPSDSYPDPHFLKDAVGRMWFWATSTSSPGDAKRPGTRGLWVFNAGEWLNYNTDNGLPINDIEALLPLDEGRFLVVHAENNAQVDKTAFPDLSIWSPDRKLTAKEMAVFPSGQIPTRVFFMATDPDGKHYFYGGDKSKHFTVSTDGTVAWLSESESASVGSMLHGVYENGRTFYSRPEDKPPPAPVDPREVVCQDRTGRFYFRYAPYGLGVGVLWPSQERSGDTLRMTQPRRMHRVLQGADGTIWGQPMDGFLARWDGIGWQDAPVKIPPHPEWRNRSSPPWHRWYRQGPTLLPGANGAFLVVTVRDVYQDAAAGLKKEVVKADEKFWLEAWLLKDGKWLGPQRLGELLRAESAFLVEHFTTNSRQSGPFSMQSDGKRLWAAFGGKVFVHTDGAVTDWSPPERLAGDLPASSLCRMPDGRMLWCTVSAETELQLLALTYDGARIAGEPLPIAETLPYLQLGGSMQPGGADDWYPYATKGGDLWLWLRDRLLQFREGKWVLRKDLNRPLHEEADGSLWFLSGNTEGRGYRIVKGDQTLIYPGDNNYGLRTHAGLLTPSPSGELHAICGYWLVTLSAAETPLKREVIKARIAEHHIGGRDAGGYGDAAFGHAFELEKGRFLFDNGFIGSESQIKGP